LAGVVIFLQKYGISPSLRVRIYKAFGSDAVREIKANPYKLADEIFGIGFKTADMLAMSMGWILVPDTGWQAVLNMFYPILPEKGIHIFLTASLPNMPPRFCRRTRGY